MLDTTRLTTPVRAMCPLDFDAKKPLLLTQVTNVKIQSLSYEKPSPRFNIAPLRLRRTYVSSYKQPMELTHTPIEVERQKTAQLNQGLHTVFRIRCTS